MTYENNSNMKRFIMILNVEIILTNGSFFKILVCEILRLVLTCGNVLWRKWYSLSELPGSYKKMNSIKNPICYWDEWHKILNNLRWIVMRKKDINVSFYILFPGFYQESMGCLNCSFIKILFRYLCKKSLQKGWPINS